MYTNNTCQLNSIIFEFGFCLTWLLSSVTVRRNLKQSGSVRGAAKCDPSQFRPLCRVCVAHTSPLCFQQQIRNPHEERERGTQLSQHPTIGFDLFQIGSEQTWLPKQRRPNWTTSKIRSITAEEVHGSISALSESSRLGVLRKFWSMVSPSWTTPNSDPISAPMVKPHFLSSPYKFPLHHVLNLHNYCVYAFSEIVYSVFGLAEIISIIDYMNNWL